MKSNQKVSHAEKAKQVFDLEAAAILQLKQQLDGQFDSAVNTILEASGKVIVCGMGKSGLIGQKISATLSSTGTSSFFMHPAEAIHGDLGMVSPSEVFLAISYSGETEEVIQLLPFLIDNGNPIIAMTGNPDSTLARNASVHLNVHVKEEACPLNLAPTASTTASLALGDALAVTLMSCRNFLPEQFARFHPGGSLGKKLLTRVRDIMRTAELPCVSPDDRMDVIIPTISEGRSGLTLVGAPDKLQGVISDGDIRRAMELHKERFLNLNARETMTRSPKTVSAETSAQHALELMNEHSITALPVVDEGSVVGIVQLFDCNL